MNYRRNSVYRKQISLWSENCEFFALGRSLKAPQGALHVVLDKVIFFEVIL